MESYLANKLVFRKLLLLFQLVGKAFLFIPNFYSVVRHYVVVGSEAREVDEGRTDQNLKTSDLLVKREAFCIYMKRVIYTKVISNAFLNFTISLLTLDYQWHQYWQQTEKFVVVATKH